MTTLPASVPHSLVPHSRPRGWLDLSSHRAWLAGECDRLLDFAAAARHPAGGFGWLDDDGRLLADCPVETYITARMTHVFSLAQLIGRPGARPLAEHGVGWLRGPGWDVVHGGWSSAVGGASGDAGDTGEKRAYDHVFVVLAAASATVAGVNGARDLLDQALGVLDERFWDDRRGLLVDVWSQDWSVREPYGGVNANMHGVEALLAAADATGQAEYRDRALRVATQVLHRWARDNQWRIPEHYDAGWNPLPEYNRDHPDHPFRPYGATVGHGLEWARLALHLRAGLGSGAPDWLLPAARALFDRAVTDGWAVDGADGFVYTTDWAGRPVVRERMHWVLAEALGAAAALHEATGEPVYDAWYQTWWDYAARYLLDRDRGSWHHQLDPANRPASSVWAGKPDAYHAVQATLVPRLPLSPGLAAALAAGLLRT